MKPMIEKLCFYCDSEHVKVVRLVGRVMTVNIALCEAHRDRVKVQE